jgi:hypothetical protein
MHPTAINRLSMSAQATLAGVGSANTAFSVFACLLFIRTSYRVIALRAINFNALPGAIGLFRGWLPTALTSSLAYPDLQFDTEADQSASHVIASDSEAIQTKPPLETSSLGRFALLAMTEADLSLIPGKVDPAFPGVARNDSRK